MTARRLRRYSVQPLLDAGFSKSRLAKAASVSERRVAEWVEKGMRWGDADRLASGLGQSGSALFGPDFERGPNVLIAELRWASEQLEAVDAAVLFEREGERSEFQPLYAESLEAPIGVLVSLTDDPDGGAPSPAMQDVFAATESFGALTLEIDLNDPDRAAGVKWLFPEGVADGEVRMIAFDTDIPLHGGVLPSFIAEGFKLGLAAMRERQLRGNTDGEVVQ